MTQSINNLPKAYEDRYKNNATPAPQEPASKSAETPSAESQIDALQADLASGDGEWAVDQPGYSTYVEGENTYPAESGYHPQSVDDMRMQLQDLLNLLNSNENITTSDRKKIEIEIRQLQGKLDYSQGYISDTTKQHLLQNVASKISAIEAQVLGDVSTRGSNGSSLGEAQGSTDTITDQIKTLKDQINQSDIPQSKKDELIGKLDRAQASLEMFPDKTDEVVEKISEVKNEYEDYSLLPAKAIELADKLKISVEAVTEAADSAGVNFDNLPNPPDEKVAKMLEDLGVPTASKIEDFKQLKEQRDKNIKDLKDKNDRDTERWRANSEDCPMTDGWEKSFRYFKKEDDEYRRLTAIEKDIQGEVVNALQALGYSAEVAGRPDQITVGGTTLDFFKEDSSTFTLSTTTSDLTQTDEMFSEAPRNEEAGTNKGIENTWYQDNAPDGYPQVTFDSG